LTQTSPIQKRPPLLFPLLLAIYPVLTLYEWNIREMPSYALWRPVFLALGLALLLMALIHRLLRDWVKSALLSSLFLLLAASYGQVHHMLMKIPFYKDLTFHHWLLGGVWLILFITGAGFILKKGSGPRFLWSLNAAAVLLVIIPTVQIAQHQLKPEFKPEFPTEWLPVTQTVDTRPDIYYLILDGYARTDFMNARLNYDNSNMDKELSNRGFYVAECSRANYNNTIIALTSTLNMEYFSELEALAKSQGLGRSQVWRYLKPNITMQTLQSLGYHTVAFDTGYYWSSFENVDTYLQPWDDAGNPTHMTTFEYLLLKSTPLVALYEREGDLVSTDLDNLVFPYRYHVAQQEYILDHASRIADIDGPTFAFIHIMIPHEPMVFSPEGINTSPLYFGASGNWPRTPFAFGVAYLNGVKYVNPRILEIVDQIIAKSDVPPIIIVQGDHGFWSGTNLPILNAYYLPGDGADLLYPTISPVNSFRLIFDHYFGAELGLLEDTSYLVKDIKEPVGEALESCSKSYPSIQPTGN
jgi:hypothetical protein